MDSSSESGKVIKHGCFSCISLLSRRRAVSIKSKALEVQSWSESCKSEPTEDPGSEGPLALDTTKSNAAGRRLRSDSPIEDGVLESQPLKRQNSMGEMELPRNPSAGLGKNSPSFQSPGQLHQESIRQPSSPILGKYPSFPPSKAEVRTRMKSQELPLPLNYNECPPFGSKSVIGRRAKMEDACVAVPYLLEVTLQKEADELLPPRLAPQLRSNSGISRSSGDSTTAANTTALVPDQEPASSNSTSQNMDTVNSPINHHTANPNLEGNVSSSAEMLHFFGVFDGHGGADAAMHCAKTLHERLKDVLSQATSPSATTTSGGDTTKLTENNHTGVPKSTQSAPEFSSKNDNISLPTLIESNSNSSGSDFLGNVDIDDRGREDSEAGRSGGSIEGVSCTTETVEAALMKAFHITDKEFGEMGGYEHLALVGTTAVVALVGSRMIYVANCGDSRAVLCRDSQAVPLTDDHKAAREDETARVEAAGGQILFWNGVRVMGLLAVSRAIGDHSLRPYVIAEPEVTILNRHAADEILIMASDGLWDVMSNQEACNLAKKCLIRARQKGSSRQSAARVAATVLTRAAVDRGSRDNVTVVIVDLTAATEEDYLDIPRDSTSSLPKEFSHHSIGNRKSSDHGRKNNIHLTLPTTREEEDRGEEMLNKRQNQNRAEGNHQGTTQMGTMPTNNAYMVGPPPPPSPFDMPTSSTQPNVDSDASLGPVVSPTTNYSPGFPLRGSGKLQSPFSTE